MSDSVEREVVLPATREEVWSALLADGWLADEVELEPHPGGEARFRTGELERRGWIEEIAAPARLAFWWAAGDEPATRVELVLDTLDDSQTRLRVVETRPLEVLDLVGVPLPGAGGGAHGPALLALR